MRKRDYSYLTVISLFYINNLKNSLLGAILLMERKTWNNTNFCLNRVL